MKQHFYKTTITWEGNKGEGTRSYTSYSRDHSIIAENKPAIAASSDPAFRGDASRYNPEELFLASLSSCHMLWYLHLCAVNGVVVSEYSDHAVGEMAENPDGSGQFTHVTLHPRVTVSEPGMVDKACSLHADARAMCFIARSVNFPVHHLPEVSCYEKTF